MKTLDFVVYQYKQNFPYNNNIFFIHFVAEGLVELVKKAIIFSYQHKGNFFLKGMNISKFPWLFEWHIKSYDQ